MTAWMDDELNDRRRQGLYRRRRRLESAQGARVRLGGRELVNFSSNDYLGYAADPRLAATAARTARRYGVGGGARRSSPDTCGRCAAWNTTSPPGKGPRRHWSSAAAYAANLAAVTALVRRDDAVFSDELNHASLIDGCRLSRGRVFVYRHCDLDHLNDLLALEGSTARRRLIVTDSIFSMDGDLAPLKGLLEVAGRHDALLLLDEAHATGVLGESGRGLTDLLPPGTYDAERIIKVGTLSKALGTQGGFVCGSRRLIQYLVNLRSALHLFDGPGAADRRGGPAGGGPGADRAGAAPPPSGTGGNAARRIARIRARAAAAVAVRLCR